MKMVILTLFLALSAPAFAKTADIARQVSQSRFEVSRSALERLQDPASQLSTFKAIPSFGTGFISGIKVSSFSSTCLLPQFGIREGDVIEAINGRHLRGPGDIMEIGQQLAKARNGTKVRVNIRRGDKDFVQSYLVVN